MINHEILHMGISEDTTTPSPSPFVKSDIVERLDRIETQLTEIHEIFCKLYQAYESMSKSPMMATLIGNRLGK